MKNKLPLAVLLLLAPALVAQDYVDAVVARAREAFEVPGIAVAVVKDGRVVLSKGYGVRKLGSAAPVTPQTLFRIASNTKAFTTAALAILVDEQKLGWDDRVVDRLPAFQMYDPYVTREMTIRDLLVHRSGLGLGAGDLMFWPSTDFTREEIIRRIRFLPPASSFRSRYAYDNLLYLVAGQIVANVSGMSWEQFVRARIFTPLGMSHTNASSAALASAEDAAAPHSRADGRLVPIPHTDHDNNAPAGSINSCVEDLAKWMLLQLDSGGKLFSPKQAREMWSGVTVLPISQLPAGAPAVMAATQPNFSQYGLGWMLRDYRGHKVVYHTGMLAGYVSRTTMIPDLRLGVVVLTNQEETGAHSAITNTIIDQYLNAPPADWVAAYLEMKRIETAEGEAEVKRSASARNPNSRPSLPLEQYAGRYRDAWYGDVAVLFKDGKLRIEFTHSKQLTGELGHWHYDTFVARWSDRTLQADAFVTFSLGPDGRIAEVRIKPVSPLTDFSFDFEDLLLRPAPPGSAAR
jgi:CubicO group peptidase (beta-lactamase class C family)